MSFNIVEAIQEHVTQDEFRSLATAIGEPADKTKSAMSAGVLGIVGSLIQQGSNPTGAAGILTVLKSPSLGGVSTLWKSFFGGHGDRVTEVVAKTSGISTSSAHRVLAMLLPIAATVVGRKVTEGNLGPEGLMRFLGSQRELIGALPGAGAITGALGIPAVAGLASSHLPAIPGIESLRNVMPKKAPVTEHEAHTKKRWIPIAAALGAAALAALLIGTQMKKPVSQTTTTGADLPQTGEVVVERLFETKDGAEKVTLSDVTFDFATANVHAGKDTIEKVATLMKEHPTTVLRIEGHTDSIGDDHANEALSTQRAAAVKRMIVERGVDAKRIEAVGMGERQPVAPNDTEDGRQKNRRIDAVVVKH